MKKSENSPPSAWAKIVLPGRKLDLMCCSKCREVQWTLPGCPLNGSRPRGNLQWHSGKKLSSKKREKAKFFLNGHLTGFYSQHEYIFDILSKFRAETIFFKAKDWGQNYRIQYFGLNPLPWRKSFLPEISKVCQNTFSPDIITSNLISRSFCFNFQSRILISDGLPHVSNWVVWLKICESRKLQ